MRHGCLVERPHEVQIGVFKKAFKDLLETQEVMKPSEFPTSDAAPHDRIG